MRKSSQRSVKKVSKLAMGEEVWQLGDLFKSDFADIADPKASVKSIQDTLIAVLNVLRGGEDNNA